MNVNEHERLSKFTQIIVKQQHLLLYAQSQEI